MSQNQQSSLQKEKAKKHIDMKFFLNKSFEFIDSHSLSVMMQATKLSLKNQVGDATINDFLRGEKDQVKALGS